MKVSELAAQYVAYKQSMGMRFHTEARTLQSFCRTMGDIGVAEVTADRVQGLHRRHRPRHPLLAPQA